MMQNLVGAGALVCFVLIAVSILAWRLKRGRGGIADVEKAKMLFLQRRKELENEFFQRAAGSGKPRGLRWLTCDMGPQVLFAKVLRGAEIAALTPCTISFEAIPGGGMEDVEAVSNLRAATAVFLYERGVWRAEGRVLFNLSVEQAMERLSSELEPLATVGPANRV